MRIQILSFIFCKLRQLLSDGTVPFVFLVITTLFLSADWFMDSYLLPKNMGFVSGVVLWGIVSIIGWKRNACIFIDYLSIAFTFFIGYLFVRSLLTPQYIRCVYIGSAWILFMLLRHREIPTGAFVSILSLAGVLQAIYGVLQYVGCMGSLSYFPILGSFDNPAGFAVGLVLCYPFLLYWSSIGKRKIFKLIICAFLVIAVILSGSRTGMLTLFVMTFLFCTIHYRENIRKRRTMFIGGGVLIFVSFFVGLIYLKPASASGRMLIWKVSVELCRDHVLLGNGIGSFKRDYMLAQSHYLSSPQVNETEKRLAGETNHPFNEYLLILIESGGIGVILLLYLLFFVFQGRVHSDSPELLALIGIALFSCFSYPFKYVFVWLISVYCLSSLAKNKFVLCKMNIHSALFSISFVIILIMICIFSIRMILFEREWKQLASKSKEYTGLLDEDMLAYAQLNNMWNGNPCFLYNYGAELNRSELYKESLDILLCCELYINTYDLQMYLADNYYHLSCWTEAESRYKKALAMCPNRFLPLQGLLKLYIKLEDYFRANQIVIEILDKPIKVPSYTVSLIREEAKNYFAQKRKKSCRSHVDNRSLESDKVR